MPVHAQKKTKKIYIDFQGGSHGNYLEFVCNRFLAGIPTSTSLPFNDLNAAHEKKYLLEPRFECGHFTNYGISLNNETVISIHIDADDLLPLQCVSLLRAGDHDIKPEELEFDTYHKLHNKDYQCVLDNLLDSFFNDQDLIAGYKAIADPSWPQINSRQDYHALPEHIRKECEDTHAFVINTLDKDYPDCPREILIEFFRIGFMNPAVHGFIQAQKIRIHTDCDVYQFPFACFYDEDKFMKEMISLSTFLKMPFDQYDKNFAYLHQEFLQRQLYKDIRRSCDHLIQSILQGQTQDLPTLDVIQEAYVRAGLAKQKTQ